MKETVVYLIRHGDVDNPGGLTYGRERNVHLSAKGKEQILVLGSFIKARGDIHPVLVTSPLLRTLETARILSDILQTQGIQTDTDLLETDSKGFVGLLIEKIRKHMGDIYKKRHKDFEIERPESMADRMKRAFYRAVESGRGMPVCIVSHGDPLAFLCDALLHPDKPLRPITELRRDVFLQKGEAWRCVVNQDNVLSGWEKVTC